jgi:hypothetical protein
MAWFRVDDRFRSHRKVLAIPRKQRRDATSLWYAAGNWCADQVSDGHVPTYMVDELEFALDDAAALVAAGLWDVVDDGWVFHDWADYNPLRVEVMANQIAKQFAISQARSAAGKLGAAKRWGHEIVAEPDDTAWQTSAVAAGQDDKPVAPDGTAIMASDGKLANDAFPTRPDPTRVKEKLGEADASPTGESEPAKDAPGTRPDVDELCDLLAANIGSRDGARRVSVNRSWRTAGRLLLDADGRTPDQVRNMLGWLESDDSLAAWWRPNIRSMPTLRDKYDQMREQRLRPPPRAPTPRVSRTTDLLRTGAARVAEYKRQEAAAAEHTPNHQPAMPLQIGP